MQETIDVLLNQYHKEMNRLENALQSHEKIVVFGTKKKALDTVRYLSQQGYKVDAFSDNNKAIWNTGIEVCLDDDVEKLTCIPPEKLTHQHIVIMGMHMPNMVDVMKQLLGKVEIFPIESVVYLINREKIDRVYNEFLNDSLSKKSYLSILIYRMTGIDKYLLSCYQEHRYSFPDTFRMSYFNPCKEIFIDCGGGTGDTLEEYVRLTEGTFSKVYVFEPGNRQYGAICARKKRLVEEWALQDNQIEIIQAGVGKEDGEAIFYEGEEAISASKFNSSLKEDAVSYRMEIKALDMYQDEKITMIKWDVEGMEKDSILGSQKVIMSAKPRLAISLYHRVTDLFELPILVNQILPEYRMMIVCHAKSDSDFILYCWVEGKIETNYPTIF